MDKNKLLWQADLENGYYKNPILFTDYSDPDVIRVGDTFFMTASSFNCVPGLPVLVSKDLVSWEICNYGVTHLPFETYDSPAHGKGIWAPSIRYHHNKYWIFVGMPDEGIFMTHTEDPFGEWCPLICIWSGKGFIDPCPFWDEDGKAYIVHAYAKSRIGFQSKLGLLPMSQDGTKCIGEDRFIFDGSKTQPTIEGPKVYKRGKYYYIFAPAGGVATGWQTVLRSTSIYGPYEEKIVMHQGSTEVNGPHQGGLVDTPNQEEWFVHFQDKGVYGRIVHLQPVRWKNDWPIIGENPNEESIGKPVLKYKKPSGCQAVEPTEPETSDDFQEGRLGLSWQWLANPKENYYSMNERKGYLRLYAVNPNNIANDVLYNCGNVLTQKIAAPDFEMVTKIDVSQLKVGTKSGVTVFGMSYAYVAIIKKEEDVYLQYVTSQGKDEDIKENLQWEKKIQLDQDANIWFKINFNKTEKCQFSTSVDGVKYNQTTDYFTPSQGKWVGAKIGLFALNEKLTNSESYIDVEYVKFMRDELELCNV
ncbi:beta-xylosidase [Natranaerovirga hydrolytica]|uniref:Beta-xylosidase n=1 Tax=Natranaerovirga hydrolytica TaxID=680378 RepID=A0A4R1MZ89_9FIRM|nr:glycoside hydrolase 43 family protein [Natranaerovirga hydrolytica]TCK98648.1 beta-xylosidase [Natranaerovirga hydrolytica]